MDATKRARLEAQGWKVGTVAEFLELTPEEAALIEMKLALSNSLQARRAKQTTPPGMATKLKERQPDVANLNVDDTSVSLDWLVWAMLTLGATPKEIGTVIARVEP